MARRLALVVVAAMIAVGFADVRLGGSAARAEVVKFRRASKPVAAKSKAKSKARAKSKSKRKRSKPAVAKKKKPAVMVKRPMP